jgi:hypothetical protein
MKRNLLIFVMSVIVFINANASVLSNSENIPADSTTISFTETSHDYGTIKKGSDGTYVFTFKNTGNIPWILSSVQSSCGCTTPSWPNEPIEPGKSGEIKVEYNTNIIGSFQKSVTIFSNAKTVVLFIKGFVQE